MVKLKDILDDFILVKTMMSEPSSEEVQTKIFTHSPQNSSSVGIKVINGFATLAESIRYRAEIRQEVAAEYRQSAREVKEKVYNITR